MLYLRGTLNKALPLSLSFLTCKIGMSTSGGVTARIRGAAFNKSPCTALACETLDKAIPVTVTIAQPGAIQDTW